MKSGTRPARRRRRSTWDIRAAGTGLAFALIAGVPGGCQHNTTTEQASAHMNPQAAVNHTLNSFHAAAANADFERYFADWTGQSVFLGTDATERWEGEAFKDFARPYFEKGQGWTYLPRDRHISISGDGNTAWFDELLDHEKYGVCRGSGVLLRSGSGGWTIVQYNLSFPIPNDLAPEVTSRVKGWKPGAK